MRTHVSVCVHVCMCARVLCVGLHVHVRCAVWCTYMCPHVCLHSCVFESTYAVYMRVQASVCLYEHVCACTLCKYGTHMSDRV